MSTPPPEPLAVQQRDEIGASVDAAVANASAELDVDEKALD